jgi:lysophospholipase L1-like esterase
MMSRPSRIVVVFFLALIASSLLVGAEAAYRYRTARRAGRGVQVRYYPHARLGRALVRDVDYQGVVHINRFGFRGADFDSIKAAGVTRIMVVGASTTFDPCAAGDAETWPERLEYWLTQQQRGQSFEVINAGVPGLEMSEHVLRLQTELYAYQPDVFLVYAGHGIVTPALQDHLGTDSHMPDAARVQTPWDYWLRTHSRLYERVRPGRRAQQAWEPLTNEQWAAAVDRSADEFQRNLTNFTLMAQAAGARVVFAEINTFAGERTFEQQTPQEIALWRSNFSTPPAVLLDGYARFHRVWQTVADSVGATFVPAASIGISGSDYFCTQDPIHFNQTGAETFARRMAEQLIQDGVVSPE